MWIWMLSTDWSLSKYLQTYHLRTQPLISTAACALASISLTSANDTKPRNGLQVLAIYPSASPLCTERIRFSPSARQPHWFSALSSPSSSTLMIIIFCLLLLFFLWFLLLHCPHDSRNDTETEAWSCHLSVAFPCTRSNLTMIAAKPLCDQAPAYLSSHNGSQNALYSVIQTY